MVVCVEKFNSRLVSQRNSNGRHLGEIVSILCAVVIDLESGDSGRQNMIEEDDHTQCMASCGHNASDNATIRCGGRGSKLEI